MVSTTPTRNNENVASLPMCATLSESKVSLACPNAQDKQTFISVLKSESYLPSHPVKYIYNIGF